jgi:hypothetical protein
LAHSAETVIVWTRIFNEHAIIIYYFTDSKKLCALLFSIISAKIYDLSEGINLNKLSL